DGGGRDVPAVGADGARGDREAGRGDGVVDADAERRRVGGEAGAVGAVTGDHGRALGGDGLVGRAGDAAGGVLTGGAHDDVTGVPAVRAGRPGHDAERHIGRWGGVDLDVDGR